MTNSDLNKHYFTSLLFHILFLTIFPFLIYFIALIQFTSISITRLDEVIELIIMIVLFILSLILPYLFNRNKLKFLKNKNSSLSFFITRTLIVFLIYIFGYIMFNLTGSYPLLGYFCLIGITWSLFTIPRKSEFKTLNQQ
ncbi:MAG: hypothetical protein D8M61_13760 [Ignavibacteriae bacterium]|nr:hypothetical protein [Ignavibacteriota bacterium]